MAHIGNNRRHVVSKTWERSSMLMLFISNGENGVGSMPKWRGASL
jgi:hypothetical protein